MTLPTEHKGTVTLCIFSAYFFTTVSYGLAVAVAGSFRCNNLGILPLSGFLVHPIRIFYLPLIKFMKLRLSVATILCNELVLILNQISLMREVNDR